MSALTISDDRLNQAIISGKKINSAADDPAGLAIAANAQKETSGLTAGAENAKMGQDVIKTADGALSSIQDSLQRIRELSVQASNNAIYSPKEISSMQKEIDGLKQSIQDTAKGTSFNTIKLLDGSRADMELATNPRGGGMKIQLVNSTLESLGIEDYDVTGKFSIKTIDDAISKISDARSSLGAQSNALDHTSGANTAGAENSAAFQSKTEDLDYGSALTRQQHDKVMEQYRIFSLKAETESQSGILKLLQ